MGTWGSGNLDSDYALDELSTRTHQLLTPMLLRWQGPDSREWDEYDHTTLFVELELVFALDAQNLMGTGKFPAPAEMRALIESWLADYDDFMDEPWPERRAKIVETFDRFVALCEKHAGTAPLPQAEAPAKPAAAKPVAKARPAPKPKAKATPKPKPKTKPAPKPKSKPKAGKAARR